METSKIDIKQLRQTLGSFLTGVTVVSSMNSQGQPIGFTANSFTSVSLEPPLVLVCLAKTSANCESFSRAKSYAINILAEDQQQISSVFASPVADRYEKVNWRTRTTGSPVIDDVSAWLDCNMHQVIDAGDHLILIGEIMAFDHTLSSPLGYLRGNYVRFTLEQQAVKAMENPLQATSVAAIIESQGALLLIQKDNQLQLPQAPRLGDQDNVSGLLGQLSRLGLSTPLNHLFAVYENTQSQVLSIVYRAQVDDSSCINAGEFYAFDDVPLDRLSDAATRAMLKRYIHERKHDAFGIYVGNQQQGAVETLAG